MSTQVIDFAEWTQALEAVQRINPERKGLTAREIGVKMGKTVQWVREKVIRPLADNGQVSCRSIQVRQVDGKLGYVPEYIFKTTEAATGRKGRQAS